MSRMPSSNRASDVIRGAKEDIDSEIRLKKAENLRISKEFQKIRD